MKRITLLCLGLLVMFSCSKEDPNEIADPNSNSPELQKLLSIEEVNTFIEGELKSNGDVDWTSAPAVVLWSATVHGDNILSIGYGSKGESYSEQRSPQLIQIRENIFSIVETEEQADKSSTTVSDDDILNNVDLKVTKLETIIALQDAEDIRYLEPAGYGFYLQNTDTEKSAGCSQDGQSINGGDYRTISPNAKLPWNFDIHRIPQAWGYSTGAGITVGLIDTGLSANQNLLGSGFNDGASNGRTVQRFGTFIDSPWWWSNNIDGPNDRCGHGTQMASAIASPRNDDFMPVGVAYNSNLVAYRGTEDVVLNDYHERKGVSNALKALGNRGDVKIISMSVGYPWSIGNVKDAVRYAYGKGKMIIAAGGTSTTFTNWYGVIFPASMSETVAVTGLKDNGYNRCNICHDGSKIDFTIVMQRASNTSRTVPVLGFNNGTQAYVGGSSVATAMTAGIAALVWARNPNMSRAQVLDKLKRAGDFYPNRNSKFGYGNIDALKAVQ
ncbi:S8/S53 family peptidase [Aquimarina sp. 2201CG5-10]|uniref:S8 family peptidase n=1 Tax=Aquimarina callyspongiae TaxID=3098150 RepID=UPI002AB57C95|nr:S8/S53 family peptidase [Aquimarina sp. 2201CG5-10]MDY8138627.1 S8/S53 family peptidase [Aquimarina sp. 2201CG5-10]